MRESSLSFTSGFQYHCLIAVAKMNWAVIILLNCMTSSKSEQKVRIWTYSRTQSESWEKPQFSGIQTRNGKGHTGCCYNRQMHWRQRNLKWADQRLGGGACGLNQWTGEVMGAERSWWRGLKQREWAPQVPVDCPLGHVIKVLTKLCR